MTVSKEQILQWLCNVAVVLTANKTLLTDLDAAIGDGDHGANISRGFTQVVVKMPATATQDLGAIFKATGMTLMSAAGGASGMLYGNFFMRAAVVAAGKESLTPDDLVQVLSAGVDGIVQRGRAVVGDKTMIDGWMPAVAAIKAALEAGQELPSALNAGAAAAEAGMLSTIPLQAKKGRASYLGERSVGHQDPGATSSYLILRALADEVK